MESDATSVATAVRPASARSVRRSIGTALSVIVLAAVPMLLIGNAMWLLVNPWFIDAQYALPGSSPESDGVQDPTRTTLAKVGLRSIRAGGEGLVLLQEARLPNGRPAFEEREISHMADVRGLIAGLLTAWAIAFACALVAGLTLLRLGEGRTLRQALRRGSWLTVAAFALVGIVMTVDFETFFNAFHDIFFAPGTWRFGDQFTLRQLYPDQFWVIGAITAAGLVLLQAAALLVGLRQRPRTV